ncbi:MAG: hypothetical protein IJM79_08845 [Erysipelotrichaceae bacterium]|nr:hypothetical protein [Erysipelotrichaceae bacterium]
MKRKIIVIGCPGSGKSTFCRRLHELTGLPLYHLDMLYWNADRTIVEREVFMERLNGVLERDSWIIDGNYLRTMELRLQKCEEVFFLDYPAEICEEGILARRGKPRSDMPWTEMPQEIDEELLERVRNFQGESRPRIMELLSQNEDKEIHIFTDRGQADGFLEDLRETKKPDEYISDGVLAYGAEVGHYLFEKSGRTVYVLARLEHIGPSDVLMVYQISPSDYRCLTALSQPRGIPEPPVDEQVIESCLRNFLCGQSAYCVRSECSLPDADPALSEATD